MKEPVDGFKFLEDLRNKNGKKIQNFISLAQYLDDKARIKGVPVHGQFELTPLCNFGCKMCYVHLDAKQMTGQQVMPVEKWKDLMHQALEAGMMHAALTGGECLAYPGFDEIFLYLQSLGVDIAIMTNGYLLDDKRIEFFRQHLVTSIQITLYGWNDDVYERVTGQRAFNVVVNNTCKAIEAGLPVKLTVTPNKYLGEDVLETIRTGFNITKAFSVSGGLFTPREETGRSQQRDDSDLDLYVRIYKLLNELSGRETIGIDSAKLPPVGGPSHKCDECGLRCGGARSGFVMNWKGELLACNRLGDYIHANAVKDGFKKAWAKINFEANHWPRVPECEGCAYEKVCFNCAATTIQYAEPGKIPIGLCEKTKCFVQHGIRQIPDCEE